ncbi:HET-domain-containing protein [Decorospora gaudefroyi]|uniref:HET-domain-containing protein n=1 Tax=Decorospora gaudefroyi TaxID=184978 RepID=A0A6A5KJB5_9PLEO|nr:HET-domain-containing protein [Decorospora gaudefroyi]
MQQTAPSAFLSPQSPNDFRYRPLNPADGEDIRLVCLYPGDVHERIRCDLVHASLEAEIEYEALSYTWASEDGDTTPSQAIACAYIGEERVASLSVTSNCASALRRLRFTSHERILWIDAIAIDQTNLQERNHQVGLMGKIYSGAAQVLVYLGEDDLDFGSRDIWLDSGRRYSALKRLFAKRWASRVWVIQEVALAQKVVMVTGAVSCQMDVNLMSRIRGRAKAYGLHVPGPLAWDPLVSVPTRDLLILLHISRDCLSADPRDKIYGLLGLVSERLQNLITIDYSQTIEEVLTRTAAAIIICREDFEILAYASASICTRHKEGRLPTWVPDWMQHRGDRMLHSQFQRSKIGPWRSLEKLSGSPSHAVELAKIRWDTAVHIPLGWPKTPGLKPFISIRAHCLATIDSTTKRSGEWQNASDFSQKLMALIGSDVGSDINPQTWPRDFKWLFDPRCTRLSHTQAGSKDKLVIIESLKKPYLVEMQRFCAELAELGKNKYFFKAGFLPAITSHDIEEGDTVWAVDGCPVLLVLRNTRDVAPDSKKVRSYRIVGDCYLLTLSHLDCFVTSGTGFDQRWDFDPFRYMDTLGTQTINIF